MQGDHAAADRWETQTRELLEQINHEIDEIYAEAERRVAPLGQRKRALEEALRAYRSMMNGCSSQAPRVAQQEGAADTLDTKEIEGLSQKDILKLIASRNGNVLMVAHAKKLMKDAGVFGNPEHSDSAVYSVILRSPEFVKIEKGIYRVEDAPRKATAPHRENRGGGSGLRRYIRTLKEVDPSLTKERALDAVLASGFDFGEKRPESAFNMAWVAEGYAKKEGQRDGDIVWSARSTQDTTDNPQGG